MAFLASLKDMEFEEVFLGKGKGKRRRATGKGKGRRVTPNIAMAIP